MSIGINAILLSLGRAAGAAFGVDGSATSNGNTGNITTFNLTHTTSLANDLLVAVFFSDNNIGITGSFNNYLTVTFSGDGLTWTRRSQNQVTMADGISKYNLEIWTAPAATAATRTTTATMPGNLKGADCCLTIFGVFGQNATIFDTNALAKAFASNTGATNTTPTVNITTNHASDLILNVSFGASATGAVWPVPTGYTSLFQDTLNNAYMVSYKIVSATQSAAAVSAGTTGHVWIQYCDAIQAA